jgi:hypothetical protein
MEVTSSHARSQTQLEAKGSALRSSKPTRVEETPAARRPDVSRAVDRLDHLQLESPSARALSGFGPNGFGLGGLEVAARTGAGDKALGTLDEFGMTADPRQRGEAGMSLSTAQVDKLMDRISGALAAVTDALDAVGLRQGAALTAGFEVGRVLYAGITLATGKTVADHVHDALDEPADAKPVGATMPIEGSATLPKGMTVLPSRVERAGLVARRELVTRATDVHGDRPRSASAGHSIPSSCPRPRMTEATTNPPRSRPDPPEAAEAHRSSSAERTGQVPPAALRLV